MVLFAATGLVYFVLAYVCGLDHDQLRVAVFSGISALWIFNAAKLHSRVKKDRWRG